MRSPCPGQLSQREQRVGAVRRSHSSEAIQTRGTLAGTHLVVCTPSRKAVVSDAQYDFVWAHDAGADLHACCQQRRCLVAPEAKQACPPAHLFIGVLGPAGAQERDRHKVVLPGQVPGQRRLSYGQVKHACEPAASNSADAGTAHPFRGLLSKGSTFGAASSTTSTLQLQSAPPRSAAAGAGGLLGAASSAGRCASAQ